MVLRQLSSASASVSLRVLARALAAWWGIGFVAATPAHAAMEEDDFAQIYAGKGFVSIATGSVQPVARAPAIATVITAADIEAVGARTVDEALVRVPGLHVSRSSYFYNSIYAFRGIQT